MKKTTKNETAGPVLHVNGNESFEEQIAHRAHELWQHRGSEHGNDLTDWLQAEQEITDWHHHHSPKT